MQVCKYCRSRQELSKEYLLFTYNTSAWLKGTFALGRKYKENVFQTARFDFFMALPWWTLLITVTSGHLRTLQDNKETTGEHQRSDGISTERNYVSADSSSCLVVAERRASTIPTTEVEDFEKLINKQKDKKTNSIMLVEANSGFHPMLIS